jgi:chemotaxis response regulator CheB
MEQQPAMAEELKEMEGENGKEVSRGQALAHGETYVVEGEGRMVSDRRLVIHDHGDGDEGDSDGG